MKFKLNKKILNKIYFILFILLNLADFYGISGDIDFFKKILSWLIIGYLFYIVSPTKIFIGTKDKLYDILFIFSFSFMTIIKSIALYLQEYNSNNYHIFKFFLNFLNTFNPSNLILFCFFLGSIFLLIITILLLNKHSIKKDSLIGSIKLNEYLYFIKFEYILLLFAEFFFALTIFNFFMEWFAIAVDAIILVLGLIYYIFKYIHNHTKVNTNFLQKITNTGNDFLQNLIKTFSNKKTIFIGFGFILTLHLLVDGGAYLIPYSVGTGSSLYFNSLDTTGTQHIPILNLKTISNSLIYSDITTITKNNNIINSIILNFSIILIYFTSLFLFFSLLISPFYIFYKNIKKEKIIIKKKIAIFFLISLIFFILINIINPSGHLTNNLNKNKIVNFVTIPLGIEIINPISSISGIDIYTNSVFLNYTANQLLFSLILFFTISLFLIFRYEKYKYFFNKIIYSSILIFFILYIVIFFISSSSILKINNNEINKNLNIPSNEYNFNQIEKIYQNNSNFHLKIRKDFILNKNTKIKIEFFSNTTKKNRMKNKNLDFIILKINDTSKSNHILTINPKINLILKNKIKFYNLNSNKLLFKSENNFKTIYLNFKKNEFNLSKTNKEFLADFSFQLEQNYLTLNYKNKLLINYNTNDNKILLNQLKTNKLTKTSKKEITKIITTFRNILNSIFYIFGLIFFIYFYSKNNIISRD